MSLRSISAVLLVVFAAGCISDEAPQPEPYTATCGEVTDVTEPEVRAALAGTRPVALGAPQQPAPGLSSVRFTAVPDDDEASVAVRIPPGNWELSCRLECGPGCWPEGCEAQISDGFFGCTLPDCHYTGGGRCRGSCTQKLVQLGAGGVAPPLPSP